MVNDALVVIASNKGSRTIPVKDVVTGPGSISLGPDEFIIEFLLQQPPPRTSDAYERFIPRTEMDIAVVDAAARISLDERGLHVQHNWQSMQLNQVLMLSAVSPPFSILSSISSRKINF